MPEAADLAGLRVCVVACHYAPETTGSAPYNSSLVAALTAAGASVDLVTGVPHYPQWTVLDDKYRRGLRWRERADGVDIVRVRHAVPRVANLAGRGRQELSFAALAAPFVRRSRADVVIAVTPLLGALAGARAGLRGRPLGVVVHDLTGNAASQSGTTSDRVGTAVRSAEYGLIRQARRVGVITPRFRDALTAGGIDDARILDLPIFTHITPVHDDPAAARRRLGWPDRDELLVVHTGNMGMKQGLESVLDAARLSHAADAKITFVLVGDGNQRAELESAAGASDAVRFVDPVDEQQYPDVLAAADVLLVNERPSVHEMSLPSKLTSYSAAGRPILAAVGAGGITHTLLDRHRAAHIVTPGDGAALLAGAELLRADTSVRRELVAGAADMQRECFGEAAGRAGFQRFAAALASSR